MTDAELLNACKAGLGISGDSTAFNSLLTQKIKAIQMYMRNAGVSEEALKNELAVGVIVMGVADLWEMEGGEVKFSPAFFTLLSQLTYL
jgi:hypothetical protein